MKPEVTLKYLSYLRNKKQANNEGFTLIELLVVVIIIGVLAAVALPNLLGQVGKARETEGKNAVGSANRAQQSYHFEKAAFAGPFTEAELQTQNSLGVIVPESKYYAFAIDTVAGATDLAPVTAIGVTPDGAQNEDNGAAQGTRDFVGNIEFDGAGAYGQIICQADVTGTANTTDPTTAGLATIGTVVGTGCVAGDSEIK